MEMGRTPNVALVVESRNGLLKAEFLPQPTDWMVGDIPGRQFEDDEERREVARAVMDSIEEVSDNELPYSSCTDGRWRLSLGDGQPVPVREQNVGADMVTLLVMADALGERFYQDPAAPIDKRIDEVITFAMGGLDPKNQDELMQLIKLAKILPSTHVKCGAAGGLLAVLENSARFVENSGYTDRQQQLMPQGVYDLELHQQITQGHQQRLANRLYRGYEPESVTKAVRERVGPRAVEQYRDDGRGVHGHLEQVIAYLDETLNGHAVDSNKLSTEAGLQVFGVNSGRIERLARLFSQGGDDDLGYRIARIAGEDFASAGHGTLATDMETMIIRRAA